MHFASTMEQQNQNPQHPRGREAKEGAGADANGGPVWENLLGASLCVDLEKSGPTESLLRDKSLVLLYFSAHWCPPCQAFTPKLRSFYQVARKLGVEIVYVSSDRSDKEFRDYYGSKMPWLALPLDQAAVKGKLAGAFQIRGIPALVVLDQNGNFVTDQARQHVMSAANPQTLVEQWKNTPAVSLGEARAGGGAFTDLTLPQALWQAAAHILKNPIYMFGLLYLAKFFMRRHAGPAVDSSDAAPAQLHRDEDAEF